MVVNSTASLNRDIRVATSGAEMENSLQNCVENITELQRAIGEIDHIQKDTVAVYVMLKRATKPFN